MARQWARPPTDANLNSISQEFSYAEIRRATDNFSKDNELGQGTYGTVYRGTLRDGTEVAIKILTSPKSSGFKEEVEVLSKFRHPNLVILMGFARGLNKERLLVYELLETDISNKMSQTEVFGWKERVSVALDSALGLSHLHCGNPKVFHRDIKTQNILLDRNNNAKVADFGLACLAQKDALGMQVENCSGTIGYADPLYINTSMVTEKSEVYSFGMVVLEMLTGRPPALQMSNGRIEYQFEEIKRCGLEKLIPMLDERAEWPLSMAKMFGKLALMCIDADEQLRPVCVDIVKKLRALIRSAEFKRLPNTKQPVPVQLSEHAWPRPADGTYESRMAPIADHLHPECQLPERHATPENVAAPPEIMYNYTYFNGEIPQQQFVPIQPPQQQLIHPQVQQQMQQQLQLQQQQGQEQQQWQQEQEQQQKLLQQQLLLGMKQEQQPSPQPQPKSHHLAFIPTRNPHVRHKYQPSESIDQTYVPSYPSRASKKSNAAPAHRKYSDDLFPRPKSDAKGLCASDTPALAAQSATQAAQYAVLDEGGNPKLKGNPSNKNSEPVFVPAVPRPVSKENTVPRAVPSKVEAILASPLRNPSSKAELIFSSTGNTAKSKRRQTSDTPGDPPPFPELSKGGRSRFGFQAAPGYYRLCSLDSMSDTFEKCGFQPADTSGYTEESSGSAPPRESSTPVAAPSDDKNSRIKWMRNFKVKSGDGTSQSPKISERNLNVAGCASGPERMPQPDFEDAVMRPASGSSDHVAQLIAMGFTRTEVDAALKRCSSIQAAVEFLCAPRVNNV